MRVSPLRPGRALSLLNMCSATVAIALASALAAPALLMAQAPTTQPAAPAKPADSTPPPSARSIIDRHIQATGGRQAILSHSSSHATGTMTVPGSGMTGVLNIYSAKPNKSLLKINLGGIGEVQEGFDGTIGWSVSPMTGPMLTQGKELEQKKFDADFYSDLHEEGRYESMKTVEKTMFEGRSCYKVSLVRKGGAEDFEFYDVETGLKAGFMGSRESQMGPMNVTQVHMEYKKFGPMMVPTTIKTTAIGVQQVLTLTSIEFDKVDPSTFDPPAQIKALLK